MTETTTPEFALGAEIKRNWPALSFYYGLSFQDLRGMPRWARDTYARALPGLLSSQQLRAIEASMFPWTDEGSRRQIMNDLTRHLPKTSDRPNAPRNKQELQLAAAGAGIGVVFEPKEKPKR